MTRVSRISNCVHFWAAMGTLLYCGSLGLNFHSNQPQHTYCVLWVHVTVNHLCGFKRSFQFFSTSSISNFFSYFWGILQKFNLHRLIICWYFLAAQVHTLKSAVISSIWLTNFNMCDMFLVHFRHFLTPLS